MTQEQRQTEALGLDPWGLRRVERLLRSVEGVDSLKLVPDNQGAIDEVHVLSSSGLGAKQIVRNIESALLAQFGLQIDHRKISIAHVREEDLPSASHLEAPEPEPEPEPERPRRIVLRGFQVERRAGERVECRVQLGEEENAWEGQAQGPDYAKARLEVAAQAVLNALGQATEGASTFAIEGVSQVDMFGRRLVVALVHAAAGRATLSLPGIAEVRDSVEEAVVLACLNATNRWMAE
ncbi:MAG: hypothetical protein R3266_00605 [Gemmatimonadota bacterium]|nr:hypothetical protein [Gemmatimonadota bacterium]